MQKKFFFTLFLITLIWGTLMTSPAAVETADDSCDEAVMKERRKYDPDGDGKIGLEVAIHALQVLVGARTDKDGDSYTEEQGDCDDNNAGINPGEKEICEDGIDQDCSGADLAICLTTTWYKDIDKDKYSDGTTKQGATRPAGYYKESELTSTFGDCKDNNAAIHMGATEICGDGIDQDCSGADLTPCPATATWYKDADGDKYSDGTKQESAAQPEKYYKASDLTAISGDCKDDTAAINPGAKEICGDGIDQDCSGADLTPCPATATWYKDADGDKYSDGTKQESAAQPEKYYKASDLTAISGDCKDDTAAINPGAKEICGDGIDQDCSGADLTPCPTTDTVENYALNYKTSMNERNANLFMERVSKDCLHNGQDYSCYSQKIEWEFGNYTYENTGYAIGQVSYEEKDGKKFAKFTATISYSQVLYGIIETPIVEEVTLVLEDGKWKFYGNQKGYSSPSASVVTCEYVSVDYMDLKPVGIRDVFTKSDDSISIFIDINNVLNNAVFNIKIYMPNGDLFNENDPPYTVNRTDYPSCSRFNEKWFTTYDIQTHEDIPGLEYYWLKYLGTWSIELSMDGVGVLSQKTFEYKMVK